jgi:Ca2+-binding EF-hand superfamily protein
MQHTYVLIRTAMNRVIPYRSGLKGNGSDDMVELSQELSASIDKNCDGVISFHELLNVYFPLASDLDITMMVDVVDIQLKQKRAAKMNRHLSVENRKEIVAIFQMWDKNNKGSLAQEDLLDALTNTLLSKADIGAIFRECDIDDDKHITLEEFVQAMTSFYIQH